MNPLNQNTGWSSCGCSTSYTDAWGNPINGPGSGADGSPTGNPCSPNWGLLALMGLAAIVGMSMAHKGKA